jgi:RimJ/RimL family protein N-acetyltransferase
MSCATLRTVPPENRRVQPTGPVRSGAAAAETRTLITCENAIEGDLGFIFSKDVWGMGYATEAARAMVRAGFEELGLTRIFATCDVANGASARVLEKAGLARVATLDRHRYARGKWWTSFRYEIVQ